MLRSCCSGWVRCPLFLVLAVSLVGCSGPEAREKAPFAGADVTRGAELIRSIGCGLCHTIPGIGSADGLVGPPLNRMARRLYIAGRLPNTPDNMVRWLRDPQLVSPGNVMPDMGLDERQARDITAYLYGLQ